jgi:hypothetical protein
MDWGLLAVLTLIVWLTWLLFYVVCSLLVLVYVQSEPEEYAGAEFEAISQICLVYDEPSYRSCVFVPVSEFDHFYTRSNSNFYPKGKDNLR